MPPYSPHSRTEDTHLRMKLAKLSHQTGDTIDNVYVGCDFPLQCIFLVNHFLRLIVANYNLGELWLAV